MKNQLREDEKVFAFFVSPSGKGLKVIYKLNKPITDYEFFSQLYKHYATQFKIDLGADPDKTSDASRPCYFSFDPDLYYNPQAKELPIDIITKTIVNKRSSTRSDLIESVVDTVLLRRAIEFLRKQKITYNEWLACGFALAPLGEYGRQFFQLLSDNPNYNDTPQEIDNKFQNFVNNPDMYNEIDKIYFIAVDHGFQIIKLGNKESELNIDTFDKELEEQFLIDDTRDPNELLGFPLTKFKELAVHVDGLQPGFYLLGAESNVGKTAVLTNLCLDILDTNPDVTVLYFSVDDSRKGTSYRFISIMTQIRINETKRKQTDPVKAKKLEKVDKIW